MLVRMMWLCLMRRFFSQWYLKEEVLSVTAAGVLGLSSCLLKRQGEKNNGNLPDDAPEKKATMEIQTASNISSLVLQIGSCLSLTKIAAD